MALYVYITDECMKDAKRQGRQDEIIRLKEKVEGVQRICHFENFPSPYLKKRLDRQYRLVADYQTVPVNGEDHVVVNFLRLFVRSDNKYNAFVDDTVSFGKQHLSTLVSKETLVDYVSKQLEERPIPPKPEISEEEQYFLYQSLGADRAGGVDEFVCESEVWVRTVQENTQIQNILWPIKEFLVRQVGNNNPTLIEQRIEKNFEIVFRWIPPLKKLFLAGIAENEGEKNEIKRIYQAILNKDVALIEEEEILQNSLRAYPALLLADPDAWTNVQKDVEANLALSPEETSVLESVYSSDGGYPIFINGRAGSGKSTILYYLFTDYVCCYLDLKKKGVQIHQPIIFSCSDELRKRAQDTVKNLINYNSRWNKIDSKPEVPSDCFQEFRQFLLNLLPQEEQKEKFRSGAYVNYSQFRKLWEAQFDRNIELKKKNIGPDLSWHVIRTFVKGTSSDDYLEPEDYEQLPKKQRSVSPASYKTIFKLVWEGWYQSECEEGKFWDDQDLARHVFDNNYLKPLYPAVFCDEAQDFTRIELDLLFQLCLFCDRQLKHTDVRRVPYAFAGDPFQTLNPTGFRWDAIQVSFREKLEDTLGGNLRRNIEMNYKELNLNYRSTKNVVRLCNFIQALRAVLFNITGLQPQRTWQLERSSPMPVWFDRDKMKDWEQLRKETDVMIIVPCMFNEEGEYVEKDDLLKQVVKRDDSGVPLNVFSPIRAKGLEFSRVALYGFGDSLSQTIMELLENASAQADQLLPYEYYVNQLYVAASRPKRRLFIIDTQHGKERLWKFFNDDELRNNILEGITKGHETWRDNIGGFLIGTSNHWQEERGDPEENAERLEQQGKLSRDPYMLRQAAILYASLEKTQKEALCKAYAFEFEDKFVEAGKMFQNISEYQVALKCFWKEGIAAKKYILDLFSVDAAIGNQIEYQMMGTLNNLKLKDMLSLVKNLAIRAKEDENLRVDLYENSTYAEVLNKYVEFLVESSCDKRDIDYFMDHYEIVKQYGCHIRDDNLAELYFLLAKHEDAIVLWEKEHKRSKSKEAINSPNYKKAKLSILLREFNRKEPKEFSPGDIKHLHDYFMENDYFVHALYCVAETMSSEDLLTVLALPDQDYKRWPELIRMAIKIMASQGEWAMIAEIAFASRGKSTLDIREKLNLHSRLDEQVFANHRQRSSGIFKKLSPVLRAQAIAVRNAVVAACAESDDLTNQILPIRQIYSVYFSEALADSRMWSKDLTPRAVGGAFERAGRYIDSLEFYESLLKDPLFSTSVRTFAKERMIATKEKQSNDSKYEHVKKRYARDAENMKRSFGMLGKTFTRFPEVPQIFPNAEIMVPERPIYEGPQPTSKETAAEGPVKKASVKRHENVPAAAAPQGKTTEPPEKAPTKPQDDAPDEGITNGATSKKMIKDPIAPPENTMDLPSSAEEDLIENTEFNIGNFKFEFSQNNNRVNITHMETMGTASIQADRQALRSLDVDIHLDGKNHVCKEWDCSCSFSRADGHEIAAFKLGKYAIDINFRFPVKK